MKPMEWWKPVIDDDSRPFWEGAKAGKLVIQQCGSCGKYIFYPRFVCPHCFSEHVSSVEAGGMGRIHSFTVVHRSRPPFQEQAPYVVAVVDLDEGVRMVSRIRGERSEVAIGKRVSVVFEEVGEDVTLPYFQLVPETASESQL